MRLSSAPMSGEQGATTRSIDGGSLLLSVRRSMAALMAMFIVLATVGVMAATSSPARADTPYATGQVFVSVGNGQIYVFDPASGQQLPDPQGTLTDSTVNIPPPAGIPSQFTAGTAFDANGDLFVADGTNGTISEFSPTGAPIGVNGYFASGLANPAALVFDQAGDLFVGQVDSPYIAEFSPSGQRLPDIGKLKIQTRGVDWIDLSTDQCTFYYTSEGNAVMAYNMCTKTQLPDFTQQPLAGPAAFELRIMPNTGAYNGDVLVADTDRVVLLDSSGNVAQTYLCNGPELSNWGCAGRIFGLSLDPDGTSFWTTDPFSGLVWKIDIATGTVLQAINTNAANLYGISVLGAPTAAVKQATTVASTTTAVNLLPLTTPLQYGVPTTVQAEVTATTANGTTTPLANEPVDFTLSGGVTCTGTTDANGIATCVIIPGQSSGTYTLSATFTGDTSQSTPISSSVSVPNDVTVNPETTDLTYTGPTSGVNGQPFTFSGTLTTPPGDAPLPPGQPVTFTIGSGNTAQSCTGTVDSSGNVSCTVTLDQPVSNVTITTTYEGTPYLAPSSPSGTGAVITEPTTLTVQHATGDFIDTTSVQATLSDASNNPVAGQFVTLTFNNNSNESCTVKTDANGLASCPITPSAPADGQGTYPLTASFAGDASLPLQLTGSTGANTFTVTLEPTTLTYTGATVTQNGQSLAVSGVLTTENSKDADSDMSAAAPIAGRTVTFVLGSGLNAQSCSAVTDSTGTAACAIGPVSQSPGPIPVTDQFAGDNYFEQASAASTVNLPEGTQLTVNPPSTTPIYNGPTTLSGTLTNTYTNQPVSGEPVTFTINGTQSCTADTNASGVASCTLSPNEPAGTYSYTATFTGDNTSMPQLTPSVATSTISVTTAPTTLTYTGPTSVTNGSPATFSGTLTTSEPTSGTDVSGVPVTFTIGSGNTAQSCTGTTTASGYVTCTIPSVLQTTGTVTVTDSFSGNSYYSPQTYTTSATVHTPTTLTVSDTSPAVYGGTTSLTGDLTNAVTGQPIPNEPVTLTLNGTQSCQATTDANGIATCTVMLNEPAGSYTLSGTFGGQSSNLSQPSLNPSGGTNTVTVSKAPTTTTFTSPTVVVNGWSTTLSATVSTSLGSGLTGQPVTLTIGSGSTAQSCTGTVDASGHVTCTIPTLNQVSGTLPVTVSYGGNSYYQSSSSTSTVIVASAPGSGGFVVGNVSAGATTTPKTIGNLVNFWGSQTWKTNKFTGVNNAPASMKGYIDQAPHLSATACGSTWTSDTGNSSNPPATIPPYMLVVVSSYISQGASTEYGDIQHLAVVQVGNGYGPAPGHNGWGNVVAWIC